MDLPGGRYILNGLINLKHYIKEKGCDKTNATFFVCPAKFDYLYVQNLIFTMMKFLKYIVPFLIVVLVFVMCTSEGESKIKSYNRTDISDFHLYKGSPQGAEEILFANDSIRDLHMNNYFRGRYAAVGSVYIQETYEFNESKVTCVYYDVTNSMHKQVLSDYEFRNDSLYVLAVDGSWYPVALGNRDSLYQTMALSHFVSPNTGNDSIVRKEKGIVALDEVVRAAGFASSADMTNPGDTIAWCNVRYIYK